MDSQIKLPQWFEPKSSANPSKLKLYNTLTRTKTDFIPMKGNFVSWYSCGPTVYDASHMGHARNYVTIDINRRILSDYFGYNILFVQNVTNIDDKIIVGARQEHLFKVFSENATKEGKSASKQLADRVKADTETYAKKNLPGAPVSGAEVVEIWAAAVPADEKAKEPKFALYVNAIKSALDAVENHTSIDIADFLHKSKSVLVVSLDKELGDSVTDHKIFNDLASYWENEFDNDMRALNVRPPSVTTRVSEYIPEILDFVETIIKKGFAYAAEDGSVYFDTAKFEADDKHTYAKLQPWNKGQQKLIEEGEGSLSLALGGKKSPNDFALWKSSKPGEPSWPSAWGNGRPGWHIECSVMATAVLGDKIDIHSGGIDLAFPHHDNELAQSEACSGQQQWINYFLHTGHLHIEGQKMSKSLKNFITIKESLEKYSARQLRLAFAMQQWNNQFDFKPALPEVKSFESTLNNFFSAVKALLREEGTILASGKHIVKKPGQAELQLYSDLATAHSAVHEAFADNLSVPVAIASLGELVQKSNAYIITSKTEVKSEVLAEIVQWITKILNILGFDTNADGFGWASSSPGSVGAKEEVALPFVNVLSKFRDDVRDKAIAKAPYGEFLTATDTIRDFDLLELGVSLDDRGDGRGALAKFIDGEEQQKLIQQRDEKEQREKEKLLKKAEQAKLEESKRLEKLERAKVSALEMFKNSPEQFSKFDDQGLPTHDKDGEPISKSMAKKLSKQHALQTKLHEEYLQSSK